MAKTSTSDNIHNVRFVRRIYDKGDPGTGFAQFGIDPTGAYWVDENEATHRLNDGSGGGGGGAEALGDLTDVSDATPTDRNLLIANGTTWASDVLVAADIPQLQATHIDFIGFKAASSSIDIDTELVEHDVVLTSDELDPFGFTDGSEIITVPNGMGGHYLVIIDLNVTTINSVTTPCSFLVNVYHDGVNVDNFVLDCFGLTPQRTTWDYFAINVAQADEFNFTLQRVGGTALAEDNCFVTISFIYVGAPT